MIYDKVKELLGIKSELENSEQKLNSKAEEVLNMLKMDLSNFEGEKAKSKFQLLLDISEVKKVIKGAINFLGHSIVIIPTKKTYLLSSLFLSECFTYLTQNCKTETLIYITGIEFYQFLIPNKIVNFKIEKQSAVYAKGNPNDTHRVLIQLDKFGHKLFGVFHDHMATGPNATMPSHIDIANQERMEKCGYSAISGIFSLDGYVRFFSNNMDFDVLIYGKGVTKNGDKTYHIELCEVHK